MNDVKTWGCVSLFPGPSQAGCYLSQAQLHQTPCWSSGFYHWEIPNQVCKQNQMMRYHMVVNMVHHSCDITVIMSNWILKEEFLFEWKDLLAYQVEFCQVVFTTPSTVFFLVQTGTLISLRRLFLPFFDIKRKVGRWGSHSSGKQDFIDSKKKVWYLYTLNKLFKFSLAMSGVKQQMIYLRFLFLIRGQLDQGLVCIPKAWKAVRWQKSLCSEINQAIGVYALPHRSWEITSWK